MTTKTPTEVDAGLAALTGTVTEQRPSTDLDRAMLHLRLIMEAQRRGVSWAAIGGVFGCSGKQAKARTKQLARQTQRALLLSRAAR